MVIIKDLKRKTKINSRQNSIKGRHKNQKDINKTPSQQAQTQQLTHIKN